MPRSEEHPTIRKMRAAATRDEAPLTEKRSLSAGELRELCLAAGADDVGFCDLERPALAGEREPILSAFPATKTLISFVVQLNREPIRSPARSVANLEFHNRADESNEVGRRIVSELQRRGIPALNPAMGFPMEAERWPSRMWVVAHKPVAVEAGLGRLGVHRNLIHPRFGNFILLGTVLVAAEVDELDRPIDYNPCLSCKLCVAACPTGAIKHDGSFDFQACYTHNYREFMGGFGDWIEGIADSKNKRDYRSRFEDRETVSMWQGLSFGANYKAAYCLSVCPAGEDVIGPWLQDSAAFKAEVMEPLRAKEETVYVVPDSDAEAIAEKRFPHKTLKRVRSSLRPVSVQSFLNGLSLVFQPGRARGLSAVYHFEFSGESQEKATITIKEGKLRVESGLVGTPDLQLRADARSWVGFVRRERNIVWLLLRRKLRKSGPLSLLQAFGRCFPS